MKLLIESITENPTSLMRRAGYTFQHAQGDEMSFVRIFSRAGYPRFHCYAKLQGLNLSISIHLDQKKHTYGTDTRHHGEYENDGALKEEVIRLRGIFGEKARIV